MATDSPHPPSHLLILPHPLNHPLADGPQGGQANGGCAGDGGNGSASAGQEPLPDDEVSNFTAIIKP